MSTTDPGAAVKTAPNLGKKMNQYRKKPVVITAVQFTKELRDAHIFDGARLPDGVTRGASNYHPARREVYSATFYVKTLEGEMRVELDDWVITGVKGEHYPCKPDIFAATYEPANAAQDSAPAELPIKTWQERAEESGADALTVDQCMKLAETEIAELRAALSRPVVAPKRYDMTTEYNRFACEDQVTPIESVDGEWIRHADIAAAPTSPQPVAKVLSDEQIDCLPVFHVRANGFIRKAVYLDDILAASTPTEG